MSKSSFFLIPEVMLIFYAMTPSEISKLNMNNYKLKKTSIKLIPFRSTIQNSFTGVKDPVRFAKNRETFCKCYVLCY